MDGFAAVWWTVKIHLLGAIGSLGLVQEKNMCDERAVSSVRLSQMVALFGDHPDVSRRAVRFPLRDLVATAEFAGDAGAQDDEMEIVVRDMSLSGMGFTSTRAIKAGTHLAVRINMPGRDEEVWRCVVVRCRALGRGGHRIGASFFNGVFE